MKPIPACTIVSNNYLAFARVFSESYRKQHPDAEVHVCIVDTPHRAVAYDQLPFAPIFVDELEIPGFHNFAFRYDILELNTAVKPFLLSYLRDRLGLDRLFYFDPDILILDRLDDLAARLDRHSVILTPHITRPIDDDYFPSERSILRAGIFNLGFLGIRFDAETTEFLQWWQRRLYRFCLVDPPSAMFVDQAWMNLAPAFLDSVGVVRDSIYNVAYWNLLHREVIVESDHWKVGDRRIGFFHFSGIDLDELEIISHHQDRLTLGRRPDIRPCFEHYRHLVLAAGYAEFHDLPYGYDSFQGADAKVPRTARWTLQRIDPEGYRWKNPFDARTEDSYLRWLTEPIVCRHGSLNRLALSLWEERKDLMHAFPRVTEDDLTRYVSWLRTASSKGEIDPLFLEGLREETPPEYELIRSHEYVLALIHLEQLDELIDWLNQSAEDDSDELPVITRMAMMIYEMRPDLRITYPEPLGRNRHAFALWYITIGRQTYRLPSSLVETVVSSMTRTDMRIAKIFRLAESAHLIRDLESLDRMPSLISWLNEPAPGSEGKSPLISRLTLMMHKSRDDLQERFPDPLGENRVDLARWYIGRGCRDFRLPRVLVEPVERSLGPQTVSLEDLCRTDALPAVTESRKVANPAKGTSKSGVASGRNGRSRGKIVRGVNLGGYFDAGSGVGQMGRTSVATLEHASIPFVRVPLDQDFSEKSIRNMIHQTEGVPYPVTLLNANADETIWALRTMPLAATLNNYQIGFWYWELSHFPLKFADRFSMLDEIWAATRFCHSAFEIVSPIPVRLVPPYVPAPEGTPVARSEFGLDENRFVFFYAFDAGSIPERKNPSAAIEAIRRLRLETRRPVGLLLKISRGELAPEVVPQLQREAQGLPVSFYTEKAERQVVGSMLATCDAILSLHRSEGLGLLPIEGLHLGKPVVATAYSGVTDYLSQETGFPVEYELISLDRDYPPYEHGSVWADPSIDHAVAQMLQVVENPSEARRRGETGKRLVRRKYGLEAASKRFSEELNRIFDKLDQRPPSARWREPHSGRPQVSRYWRAFGS